MACIRRRCAGSSSTTRVVCVMALRLLPPYLNLCAAACAGAGKGGCRLCQIGLCSGSASRDRCPACDRLQTDLSPQGHILLQVAGVNEIRLMPYSTSGSRGLLCGSSEQMGASEQANEGVSAARKVHGILCAAAVLRPMLRTHLAILCLLAVAACASPATPSRSHPSCASRSTGDTWRACSRARVSGPDSGRAARRRGWGEASRFSAKGWAALHGEAGWRHGCCGRPVSRASARRVSRVRTANSMPLWSRRIRRPVPAPRRTRVMTVGWRRRRGRTPNEAGALAGYASALSLCRNAQSGRVEAR